MSFSAIAALVITIITVLAVIVLVLRPVAVPLPFIRFKFDLSYAYVPVIGSLVMWACGSLSIIDIGHGIAGDARIGPWKILILFMALAYIAGSLDATGVFGWLALKIANFSKGRGLLLFLLYFSLSGIVTILTSNDVSIMTLTPVICYFAKATGTDPVPFLLAEFAAANIFSMLLFVGNPTNIIVAQASDMTFISYTKWMGLPTLAAGAACYIVLYIQYRKKIPTTIELPVVDASVLLMDRIGAIFGCGLTLVCLGLLAAAPELNWELWVVSLACALVHCCYNFIMMVAIRKMRPKKASDEAIQLELAQPVAIVVPRRHHRVTSSSLTDEDVADRILGRNSNLSMYYHIGNHPLDDHNRLVRAVAAQHPAQLAEGVKSFSSSIGAVSMEAKAGAAAIQCISPQKPAIKATVVQPAGMPQQTCPTQPCSPALISPATSPAAGHSPTALHLRSPSDSNVHQQEAVYNGLLAGSKPGGPLVATDAEKSMSTATAASSKPALGMALALDMSVLRGSMPGAYYPLRTRSIPCLSRITSSPGGGSPRSDEDAAGPAPVHQRVASAPPGSIADLPVFLGSSPLPECESQSTSQRTSQQQYGSQVDLEALRLMRGPTSPGSGSQAAGGMVTAATVDVAMRLRPRVTTFMQTFLCLPWEVVPFVLGMFVIVEGLKVQDWVSKLAQALAQAGQGNGTGSGPGATGPMVMLMGWVSSGLANVINNQPMTILLTEACLEDSFTQAIGGPDPERVQLAALMATVVASNTAANFTLLASLAGIMWVRIVRSLGVMMGYVQFAILAIPIGIVSTMTALLVLWAELIYF